jgi:hypothetical protein
MIHDTLLKSAQKEAGNKEIDLFTAKYDAIPLSHDSGCGCARKTQITLTIDVKNKDVNI